MELNKRVVPWLFITLFHILAAPILCVFIGCITYEFPDIGEALMGFLGFVMIVIPLFVAFLFGLIPFGLLAIQTGYMLREGWSFHWAFLCSVLSGAFVGLVAPMIAQSTPDEMNGLLIFSVSLTAGICYCVCFGWYKSKSSVIHPQ
ncbi:hypothetical protein I2492_12750 [Budviciaceae bacterium CWB-B4]|uniref:Uncharacterized protein n=1 Tax=Limnobaculum xujianqingii TaxID=2738837 RepID=A0A9D7AJN9_9GAMM|nr:hypothetical protein [Limnobaculum xujianqingii]MBK5073917.1 hypothetical protein [Limnobaculum xujianqingii]MBK5177189.1 hypothetical protein [Limnobaculum xujianqingii]